jgi:hypothetical protein
MPAAIPPLITSPCWTRPCGRCPPGYRPDPKDLDAAQVLVRSDSAGATDGFAAWPGIVK